MKKEKELKDAQLRMRRSEYRLCCELELTETMGSNGQESRLKKWGMAELLNRVLL